VDEIARAGESGSTVSVIQLAKAALAEWNMFMTPVGMSIRMSLMLARQA